MAKFCQNCGAELNENQDICLKCGVRVNNKSNNGGNGNPSAKSKTTAGLLGIFLGAWGVHNFYLGNSGRGAAQIAVTIVTCGVGGLWGFIEGIMILTGSIKTDANGNELQ